ncbi:MAG: hypothetical protein IJW80_04440, partial [Alistipes sp.]|nr:hypothetical protein [Alistipes sp.]
GGANVANIFCFAKSISIFSQKTSRTGQIVSRAAFFNYQITAGGSLRVAMCAVSAWLKPRFFTESIGRTKIFPKFVDNLHR